MDTLAIVRRAIADGDLEPEAAPLGQEIVRKYGEETFRYFLLYRGVPPPPIGAPAGLKRPLLKHAPLKGPTLAHRRKERG